MLLLLTIAFAQFAMLSSAQFVQSGYGEDLAINGSGWFVLREPVSGQEVVTRFGTFNLDASGYLLSPTGMRVQGYSDAALTTVGDIKIDGTGAPSTAFLVQVNFSSDGKIIAQLSDGTNFVRGQVLLQSFLYPEKLKRVDYHIYSVTSEAVQSAQLFPPATHGLGSLLSGYLDFSPETVLLDMRPVADTSGALTEGILTGTGLFQDLAIQGPGFFLVRDTNTSELFATRAGLFLRDPGGYLITYEGKRVQGYSDAALSTPGDVRIDSFGSPSPAATLLGFDVDYDGKINVRMDDGSEFVRSQILLYSFTQPQFLTPANHSLYAGVASAQAFQRSSANPSYGAGVHIGALELINITPDQLVTRQSFNFQLQGSIYPDTNQAHLAIIGNGYFRLRNPVDGSRLVTRNGVFDLDTTNFLVTSNGLRVQGFNDVTLTNQGDLRIDATSGNASASSVSFNVDGHGHINVKLSDGSTFVRGQILLQNFGAPYLLKTNQDGNFTNLDAAVPLPPAAPGTQALGNIQGGALEVPAYPDPLTLPPHRGVRIHVTGEPQENWTLQASTNLKQWSAISVVTNSPYEMEFTDTNSSAFGTRFYRVLVQ